MTSSLVRTEILKPLGFHRNRLLSCLGADLPHTSSFFQPDPDVDPFTAYRNFVEGLSAQWAAASDRATVTLLAAARLLYGELSAASTIVDHFPQRPIRTDRDAGICLLSPHYALAATLPLPEALRDTSAWLAGSPQQTALRSWIEEYAANLRWNQPAGVYELR